MVTEDNMHTVFLDHCLFLGATGVSRKREVCDSRHHAYRDLHSKYTVPTTRDSCGGRRPRHAGRDAPDDVTECGRRGTNWTVATDSASNKISSGGRASLCSANSCIGRVAQRTPDTQPYSAENSRCRLAVARVCLCVQAAVRGVLHADTQLNEVYVCVYIQGKQHIHVALFLRQ